jgi:cation diffusion facilitator CzcD-associated flavoprotein CzcO
VQQPNVHIERAPIVCVTKEGVKTEDGNMHNFDAIVCATGFDTSFLARYDIIGRNSVNLRTLWKKSMPEAYLGLAVAGFPNYFGA